MSFIRNPPSATAPGNPPSDATNTPGVVNMKLIVDTNNMIASKLPQTDALGHHGFTEQNRGGDLENAQQRREGVDGEELVDPAHQRALGDQRLDALRLVVHELQAAVPQQHDGKAVAREQAGNGIECRLSGGFDLCVVMSGGVARGGDRYATPTLSCCITSAAARSPERTAPSTQPHMTAELSVPAQWMRPQGSRSAWPNSVSTPVGAWLSIPPPE